MNAVIVLILYNCERICSKLQKYSATLVGIGPKSETHNFANNYVVQNTEAACDRPRHFQLVHLFEVMEMCGLGSKSM